MKFDNLLQEAVGEVVVLITDTAGEKYILLYRLAQNSPALPPSEAIRKRWRNVADLAGLAFGVLECSVHKMDGRTVIRATGTHACWSRGSVPFVFAKSDDPVASLLLSDDEF